ncbi:cellulase family glycosylhydrolase [Paludisphaera rhizosphaerae]|uniref:cellulase family glycosylhydrolase n=1 Tax=Paludisphaera rhizosphaerae TaxID=2711216 RepID=UPI0013EB75EB|nr:cellulase family glycosylhydrolase [Paludisphaera rhizosphaerae]
MSTRRLSLVLMAMLVSATTRGFEEPSGVPHGFVRVSPRDSRYFETDDGRAFIPIGMNLIYPPYVKGGDAAARLAALDDWLGKLAANGCTFFRVWLSNDFYELETKHAGEYDPEQARRIDAMLALARKHGLKVKMTIEHFRNIDPKSTRQTWAIKTVHHESKGGLATSMADWMSKPEARAQFIKKLEYLSARYRDDPTIFGWELWNEMDAVSGDGDELEWTRAMLPELRRLFPKQLAMQSFGSFDNEGKRPSYRRMIALPGNDVAQVHRYLDLGARMELCHGPVDVLAADAVRELIDAKPGKPVLLAESGAVEPGHSGPFKLYAEDKDGVILHDVLFAPFFAGAAGSGQCWHWDHYVAANNLWRVFKGFAQAVQGLDPPAERFEPMRVEHPSLRVYLLRGTKTSIAWCRDAASDWRAELAQKRPAAELAGLSVDLGPLPRGAKVRTYDPWRDRWAEASATDAGRISLPAFRRSIVVRVETP